jgi:SAM-dependent methyltransferase
MSDDYLNLTTPQSVSAQSAVDIFKGRWVYRLPLDGVETGLRMTFFSEPPGIRLMKSHFPDYASMAVLELGAHEGEQTFHLDRNVARVYAIEGRPANFLKCLIVKNELRLDRTHIAVGDFDVYLEHGRQRWDLCYCVGVLYHCPNPLRTLSMIARRCRRIVLSTVIYDRDAMVLADERTRYDPYPTKWLDAIEAEPVPLNAMGIDFQCWRRHFDPSTTQIVLGQGASHSLVAHLLSEQELKRALEAIGGTLRHFERADDDRSPHVHAVVEFT